MVPYCSFNLHLLMSDDVECLFMCSSSHLDVGFPEVPNPSQVVQKHVGTPSVCEAAAILGSDYGELIVPKVKGENFTAALAINRKFLRIDKGHIEIVGAGPGAPDLISVRGQRMLKIADLILYAGSLVPRELTYCAKSGAVVKSSADMNLEEQCELMKKFYDQGKGSINRSGSLEAEMTTEVRLRVLIQPSGGLGTLGLN